MAACVELLHPLDNAEFRAGNGGVSDDVARVAACDGRCRARRGICSSSSGGCTSATPVAIGRRSSSIAPPPRSSCVPATAMPPRGRSAPRGLGGVRRLGRSPNDLPANGWSSSSTLPARWEAFPDVADRCVLLAYDAAMLSGDRSLVARCQAIHQRIQELTGEPPTWRLPMVGGPAQPRRGPPRRTAGRPPAVRCAQPVRGRRHADRRIRDAVRRRARCRARRARTRPCDLWVSSSDRTARLYGCVRSDDGGDRDIRRDRPRPCRDVRGRCRRAVVGGGRLRRSGVRRRSPAGSPATARRRWRRSTSSSGVGAGRWLPSAWACVVRARLCSVVGRCGSRAAASGRHSRAGSDDASRQAERTVDAAEADLGCGRQCPARCRLRDRPSSGRDVARGARRGDRAGRASAELGSVPRMARSPHESSRSPNWWPRASPIARSAPGCSSRSAP